jgi:hypothetical protein
MEKKCTKCNIIKTINHFNKQKSGKHGVRSYCRECQQSLRKEYYYSNKDFEYVYQVNYRKNNPNYNKDWQKNKRENDILFRLSGNLRARICNILKNKTTKTLDSIGLDINKFKDFIENKFQDGMCWENYGKWHIDHIIPLSSGNSIEEILKLNHYSNLQPLWAEDNLTKSNRIIKID